MFNRRLLVFLGFVAAALMVGVLRLAHLQLVRGRGYAERTERQFRSNRRLDTYRGDIVDRNGKILATDRACFEFRMKYWALRLDYARRQRDMLMTRHGLTALQADTQVVEETIEANQYALLRFWVRRHGRDNELSEAEAWTDLAARVDATLNRAATIAEVPREQIDRTVDGLVRRVQRVRLIVGMLTALETQSHPIIDALDEAAAVQLRGESDTMTAATVEASTYRWYPYQDLACHVIGRVGRVTAETLRGDPHADDPLLAYLPSEHVGVSGVERTCEPTLRGSRGTREVHASGAELHRTPPRGGQAVRLTLDIDLQRELTHLMRQRPFNGAAVVLDVPTGEILALVSTPTYDLNTYTQQFGELISDEANLPLRNRAISQGYPPGSTIKPVAALAALAEGVVTPTTTFDCRGHADPRRPRCWSTRGHGPVQMPEAIMNSCNTYFARAAEKLGVDRLTYWYRQFGMGAAPGTGLPGESAGVVPTRRWLWRTYKRVFYPGDVRVMAIGQGPILTSPLHVANATATIARDGVYLSPVLVTDRADQQQRRELNLPDGAVRLVRRGMYRVVNDPASQTAYKHATRSGPVICGKTGTAQTGRAGGNMAWFTGFAPAANPRIALAIILEYAGGGGPNCVPLAEQAVAACEQLGYFND